MTAREERQRRIEQGQAGLRERMAEQSAVKRERRVERLRDEPPDKPLPGYARTRVGIQRRPVPVSDGPSEPRSGDGGRDGPASREKATEQHSPTRRTRVRRR